jgi:hypothetical protein
MTMRHTVEQTTKTQMLVTVQMLIDTDSQHDARARVEALIEAHGRKSKVVDWRVIYDDVLLTENLRARVARIASVEAPSPFRRYSSEAERFFALHGAAGPGEKDWFLRHGGDEPTWVAMHGESK